VPRTLREVVFVDGVRTPFGKAGEKGIYAQTRADDLVVACLRDLLRRHPSLPPERVEEVAVAAATQTGDQGLVLGRSAALLAGLPVTTPGYAIDRWCAGAMTAVTTTAASIAVGAVDVALAGGVEHMGHHPIGAAVDVNPRFVAERLVSPDAMDMGKTAEVLHDRFPRLTRERADAFAAASQHKFAKALVMGSTAENLHDRLPHITKERTDRFGLNSQLKTAKAYADGKLQPDLVPVAIRSAELGWGLATVDEAPRETSMEKLATLKTPFRPHGRVTAGNAAGRSSPGTLTKRSSALVTTSLMRLRLPSSGSPRSRCRPCRSRCTWLSGRTARRAVRRSAATAASSAAPRNSRAGARPRSPRPTG
jgi:acetyl-CoA acyltransferase